MAMPVNISDVLNIATDMQEVRDTPLSVSLVMDPTASSELSAHVRAAFASEAANTRVRISYVDDIGVFESEREGDDIAVLVAGSSPDIGRLAEACRAKAVPTMVVTDDGAMVAAIADAEGFSIPDADIVVPERLESAFQANVLSRIPLSVRERLPFIRSRCAGEAGERPSADSQPLNAHCACSGCPDEGSAADAGDALRLGHEGETRDDDGDAAASAHRAGSVLGRAPLAAEDLEALDARMGKWIIAVCKKKDLAFAYSFPFVRRPLAMESISMTAAQNAAVGFVPILPGADMPVMTLNQMKMTLQIATAYGQPVDKERIKEMAAVVGGAFFCRHIVRSITKAVPAIGWVASGAMGFAATEAMGRALLEYFEAGGDIVGVANVLQTARDAAVGASCEVAASDAGKAVISKVRSLDLNSVLQR